MGWVIGVDHPDLVAEVLDEPDIAVGPGRDPFGLGIDCQPVRGTELVDCVGWIIGVDHSDQAGVCLGEPDIAVRPGRDRRRLAPAVMPLENTEMALVVGLISPMALVPGSA